LPRTLIIYRILLPFLKYAVHLTISFHYCCTHLKFDISPDFYRQNRGGSKLTRGSSQVNLTLIETETRVRTYFATPFINFKIFLKVHIKLFFDILTYVNTMNRPFNNATVKIIKSFLSFFRSVGFRRTLTVLHLYTQNCKICKQPCMFF
jgi:hypothetical protein